VKLSVPRPRQPVFLAPEVVERIAAACPEPYDPLIRLLVGTGLRWRRRSRFAAGASTSRNDS
jgi:hypothetical protein